MCITREEQEASRALKDSTKEIEDLAKHLHTVATTKDPFKSGPRVRRPPVPEDAIRRRRTGT